MTSMQHWTTGQWTVFGLTIAAGLAAVALAWIARSAVLGWTAPAPLRTATHTLAARPTLVLAAARRPLPPHDCNRHEPLIDPARQVPVQHDPMTIDYGSHGIGALPDLLVIDADPALRTSTEIAVEEAAWINRYADLSGMMPETAAAREGMRVALEPAFRTARLWLIRCGEVGAKAELAGWRMDTPTGEWPAYDVQARLVHALLAS